MKFSSKKEFNFISCSVILEAIGQLFQGKLCRNMSRKTELRETFKAGMYVDDCSQRQGPLCWPVV